MVFEKGHKLYLFTKVHLYCGSKVGWANRKRPGLLYLHFLKARYHELSLSNVREHAIFVGEDGIIAKIFELLPSPSECDGYYLCIDVGAWDGKHLSNTYNLLCSKEANSEQNWKGILIEPHPERFLDLKELHDPLGNICLDACVSCQYESTLSLSNILRDHVKTSDKVVDLLSIDVDGTDYWLMDDILRSQVVKARVICIEFNPTMPDDIIYIQERRDDIRHGSSLAALCELAKKYSYALVETTMYNAFFVLEDLYLHYLKDTVPIPDCSIEALHEG